MSPEIKCRYCYGTDITKYGRWSNKANEQAYWCNLCGRKFVPREPTNNFGSGKRILPPWTDIETAYIAGIIDGEGCISIFQRKDGSVYIRVHIVNACLPLIEWISFMFGYNGGHVNPTAAVLKRRAYYRVSVYGTRAYEVISLVKPFLRVKTKQAETAIGYWEWRVGLGRRGWSATLSLEEKTKRDSYLIMIKQLNRRGNYMGVGF